MNRVGSVALLGALSILLGPRPTAAQSADDLAKQTQNPISSLISVPLQGNWDFGLGDRDATGTLLNFQPVVPFPINPRTNIVLRVIMPLTSQPGSASDGTRINGMGDILSTAFLFAVEGWPHRLGRRPRRAAPDRDEQQPCRRSSRDRKERGLEIGAGGQ